MRRSVVLLLSRKWSLHSEQIKQWIANANSEPNVMSLARTYIYNLPRQGLWEDLEDGLELVYLMHKVGYPRGSHLERCMKAHILLHATQITPGTICTLTSWLKEQPESLETWCAIVFSDPVVLGKLDEVLHSMAYDDVIDFAVCIWAPSSRKNALLSAKPLSYLLAQSIASLVQRTSNESVVLLRLAQAGVPLWDENLSVLEAAVVRVTNDSLSCMDACQMLSILSQNFNCKCQLWIAALQRCILKTVHAVMDTELIADAFAHLVNLSAPLEKELLTLLASTVSCCSDDKLLLIASSLKSATYTPFEPLNAVCLALRGRVSSDIDKLSKKRGGVTDAHLLQRLHCLSIVDVEKTKELWTRFCDDQHFLSLRGTEWKHACAVMLAVDTYPQALIDNLVLLADGAGLDQETCIHLLHITVRCGRNPSPQLLKHALGKSGSRKFCNRNSPSRDTTAVSNEALITLVATLSVMKTMDDRSLMLVVKDLMCDVTLRAREKMVLLMKITGTPARNCVKMFALQEVMTSIDTYSAEDLRNILLAFADASVRDALGFQALLERLGKLGADTPSVVCAARAARKIKLISQFQRSGLVESVKDAYGVNAIDWMILLSASSCDQRCDLMRLPEAMSFVEGMDLKEGSTHELILWLSVTDDSWKSRREATAEILRGRTPLESDEILPEDGISAIEQDPLCSSTVEVVCRICGSTLQYLDEQQVMRLFRCIQKMKTCPTIIFRIAGRALLSLADRMSVDNALLWVNLYATKGIRDDSVGKALLRKAGNRNVSLSPDMHIQLSKAAAFFGQPVPKRYEKQDKKRNRQVGYVQTGF